MTLPERILVLGSTGQVGRALLAAIGPRAEVFAPARAELDCFRLDDVAAMVRDVKPTCVINAAAYTAVDDAEADRDRAWVLNANLPERLAAECNRLGAFLVHYSTDYVFDGTASVPYEEDDPKGPLNFYGVSKLAGEQAVLSNTDRAVVLRTSWVFGATGKNFLLTMLRLAREREEISVVADQHGSPTWSGAIASGTCALLQHVWAKRAAPDVRGVYHMTAGGETTWYDFATDIIQRDPGHARHRVQRIRAIPSAAYPTPARRPSYSVLNCGALERTFGIRLPPWKEQLTQAFKELSS